ncbi:MAG TPA: efflux RND transporter periplasmic adaptor subunit [Terriglobales bacterium]|nr:efflux RND transporter periplasmic adaptor subunit [Terriglobales bacterium]
METKDVDLASLRINRTSPPDHPSKKFRRLRRALLGLAVAAILLAAALFSRDWWYPGVEVQLATASLISPAQANAVLTASGYVVARRKAAVASKGTGRLVHLGVEEGDKVKKGQVIARLENADVTAALSRARENRRLAEAELKDAKASLERQRVLLREGVVAPAEYDAAEARYKRVIAAIEVARYAVREAEVAVDNTRIVAPFDGTVLKKNADVGEIVAPLAGAASSKAAVVTIADMGSLEVEADVSEANITRVSPGQACEIRLDAYPARSYRAYVDKIVPTADRAKATVMVKIKFRAYDQRVLPEMSAKITFFKAGFDDQAAARPVLAIPASAVARRHGEPVVYQVKNSRAIELPVVVGQTLGSAIEITKGLEEGDKVIAKVGQEIHSGTGVAVQNP